MNNKLRKKVKARSYWRYYKAKREMIAKYPALKETINKFWEQMYKYRYLEQF